MKQCSINHASGKIVREHGKVIRVCSECGTRIVMAAPGGPIRKLEKRAGTFVYKDEDGEKNKRKFKEQSKTIGE